MLTFGTMVRIIVGFFLGCTGPIVSYKEIPGKVLTYSYGVDVTCKGTSAGRTLFTIDQFKVDPVVTGPVLIPRVNF